MTYSPPAVALGGYLVLGVTSAASGLAWLVGQVVQLPPDAAVAATHAGTGAIYVCSGTVITILVNGWVADRKSARETAERVRLSETRAAERAAALEFRTERKVIEAKAEADRKLIEARAEADARIAQLEARLAAAEAEEQARSLRRHAQLDGLGAVVNGLAVHAEVSTAAINGLIPAVAGNSRAIGTAPPAVAPLASPLAELATGSRD